MLVLVAPMKSCGLAMSGAAADDGDGDGDGMFGEAAGWSGRARPAPVAA